MKFGVPWSVKGLRPEAREAAKEAARRSGMSLDEWLNTVIFQQAEQQSVQASSLADKSGGGIATMHARLDDIGQRVEQIARTGPAAYAPRRSRQETDNNLASPPTVPPAMPSTRPPPSFDDVVAEIAARQRMLQSNAEPASQQQPAATPPAPAPLPVQNLSGLEDQLRHITHQIEALRRPGLEQAINALRNELGGIGRMLSDAMPRHALEAIEKQIKGLNQRIAEGRQAGVDARALGGIEHGLTEVRDALRGLTPAENLIGFNDAVTALAHKIDLIIAQRDPATLAQLISSIATLRDMSTHIASNETVAGLAAQVQRLSEKIEAMANAEAGSEAFNVLERRIAGLSDTLAEHAKNGAAVPSPLESLVESLADKIDQIRHSPGNVDAFGHLEDRIVKLVEKLDASDSRLGHLEAIERGLGDLLMQVEANKDSGPRADPSPGVNDLRHDIARTHDALDAVHGTLDHVVDRLAMIEKDICADARGRSKVEGEMTLSQPADRFAVRAGDDLTAMAAPMLAPRMPIDPGLPPDQPLEPGSGPPPRTDQAARIAASEAALGGTQRAATSSGQSFIAAARRAAQTAGKGSSPRGARSDLAEAQTPENSSLRTKMMKRVKSLFVAASIVAIVVGSIQIAGNYVDFGNFRMQSAKAPAVDSGKIETAMESAAPEPAASVAANSLALPKLSGTPPLALSSDNNSIASAPSSGLTTLAMPSLFDPPMLGSRSDVTGSIPRQAGSPPAQPVAPAKQPSVQPADRLPSAIGGPKLRSAAIAGDAAAAYEVAARFAEGRGVPTDLEEAARWYERAASKGLAPAQFRYASLLEKGRGVKKDIIQARRLYLAAAAKGNGKAMHNLAVLYAEGIDGKPDYGNAAQWFRKAAQRGIADSQYNLGVLCARGLGTAKSYPEAYKWFALAAAQGDKESAKKRDDIAAHLDTAALAAAQEAVKRFVAEPQPEGATVVAEPPGGWDRTSSTPARARPAGSLSAGSFEMGKR